MLALVLAGCGTPDRQTGRVQVIENGRALGELDRQQAVADVSRRIGFPLQLPTRLPDNRLRLASFEAVLPVSGIEALGSDGRSNAVAIVTWASGGSSLRLQEFSRRMDPPAGFEASQVSLRGGQMYVLREGGRLSSVAWLTGDRSYIAELQGANNLDEDDLAKMFAALK
jgi:hypothetical protein